MRNFGFLFLFFGFCTQLFAAAGGLSGGGLNDKLLIASSQTEPSDVDISCLVAPMVKLARHPNVLAEVQRYNHSERPPPHTLDARWPSLSETSPELRAVLDNPVTPLMRSFIALISLQGEGMLMGLDGGLVAATNHTTDFWQGDEEQFQQAIAAPGDQAYILAAQPDESTQFILIKIATPVVDKEAKNIGVLVIGFDAHVMGFRNLCTQNEESR